MTRCDTPEAMELFAAISDAIRRYQEKSGNEVLTTQLNGGSLEAIAIKMNPSCEVQPVYYDETELAARASRQAQQDPIARLQEIADLDCSCTDAQNSGEDCTRCRSCMAGGALNSLYEDARNAVAELSSLPEK